MIPDGLSLQRDVITLDMEQKIITWLDNQPWSTDISRRTQHYGYQYNYYGSDLLPAKPLCGAILEIAEIFAKAGLMNPVQCIVNEYDRTQGIAPHVDNLVFGNTIISLSIGDDGVLVFSKDNNIYPCYLPRRSVMMISGAARYEWKHCIKKSATYTNPLTDEKIVKAVNYRRISLTYRELANK